MTWVGGPFPGIFQNASAGTEIPICGGRGQLSGSNATLYTAPSATTPLGSTQKAKLYSITLCNTDTATRTCVIYLVESGGTAADNRAILRDYSLAAKQTSIIEFGLKGITLESGETVQGLADVASKVTYRLEVAQLV